MRRRFGAAASCGLLLVLLAGEVRAGGEIHATVVTTDGVAHTGAIRWGDDEGFWNETLDGYKDTAIERPRPGSLELFGVTLLRWTETERQDLGLAIPFGRMARLEPDGSRACRVVLRGGAAVRLRAGGSDVGATVVVTDAGGGRAEIPWSRIRSIDFSAGPGPGRDADRLYGTLVAAGRSFTGFVQWDRDETMRDDVLDGDERKIPFRDIVEIGRDGARAAVVRTTGGETVRLSGTNDVDDDNRGIVVTLADGRRVASRWATFERVAFTGAPASPGYDAFGAAARLSGTARTRDGVEHRGEITWDLDERWDFETLDGRDSDGLEHAVPLGLVREVRRASADTADVELRSGETLRLSGTNDVDDDNRGIRVTAEDGGTVDLPWTEIERVTFR